MPRVRRKPSNDNVPSVDREPCGPYGIPHARKRMSLPLLKCEVFSRSPGFANNIFCILQPRESQTNRSR